MLATWLILTVFSLRSGLAQPCDAFRSLASTFLSDCFLTGTSSPSAVNPSKSGTCCGEIAQLASAQLTACLPAVCPSLQVRFFNAATLDVWSAACGVQVPTATRACLGLGPAPPPPPPPPPPAPAPEVYLPPAVRTQFSGSPRAAEPRFDLHGLNPAVIGTLSILDILSNTAGLTLTAGLVRAASGAVAALLSQPAPDPYAVTVFAPVDSGWIVFAQQQGLALSGLATVPHMDQVVDLMVVRVSREAQLSSI